MEKYKSIYKAREEILDIVKKDNESGRGAG